MSPTQEAKPVVAQECSREDAEEEVACGGNVEHPGDEVGDQDRRRQAIENATLQRVEADHFKQGNQQNQQGKNPHDPAAPPNLERQVCLFGRVIHDNEPIFTLTNPTHGQMAKHREDDIESEKEGDEDKIHLPDSQEISQAPQLKNDHSEESKGIKGEITALK